MRWLAAALLAPSIAIGAELVVGKVVSVADGDTLTILDSSNTKHRIRIDGIDAPETGQAFGQRSKDSLSELAYWRRGKARCSKRDRYGRQVCKVTVSGVDVGLEQIRRGMAWHFKRYAYQQTLSDGAAYSTAESTAKSSGSGLWRDRAPMPPWEWRAAPP
jgi:endonuclease YncB( thermonuclease family)